MAVALAFTLNPLVNELQPIVERLFPISSTIKAALGRLMGESSGLGTSILVFALLPAVCEELAFRGFILSGLERQHRTRSAILLSALMFGFLHVLLSLFQQLFNATLLGIVLGLLAVRSRSILPGILFHLLNNAMGVARPSYLVEIRAVAAARRLDLSQPRQRPLSWRLDCCGRGLLVRAALSRSGSGIRDGPAGRSSRNPGPTIAACPIEAMPPTSG